MLMLFPELKKSIQNQRNFNSQNCIDRPANMDLMIEMVLEDESVLSEYLNSPEHIRMGKKYNPHVANRVSFDYYI